MATTPRREGTPERAATAAPRAAAAAIAWCLPVAAALLLGLCAAFVSTARAARHLRRAAQVFDSIGASVIVTDANRRIVAVNAAFTAATGYSAGDVVGRDPRLQQSGMHDAAFYQSLWTALSESGCWQGQVWNKRKNGEIFPVWEHIRAIKDRRGRTTHYVAVLADISSIKCEEARLRHRAEHDALTGLPNRGLLINHLRQAFERAKRHDRKIALLFVDVDHFKAVNDTCGHAVGDELLAAIAVRLKQSVRAQDLVGRLGGDEFLIICEDLERAEAALSLAEHVRFEFARPYALAACQTSVTASIGVAVFPDQAGDVAGLMEAADASMYRAKARGPIAA